MFTYRQIPSLSLRRWHLEATSSVSAVYPTSETSNKLPRGWGPDGYLARRWMAKTEREREKGRRKGCYVKRNK